LTPLELKKIKSQLLQVQAAKAELEVRVLESEENITRIKGLILGHEQREQDLIKEIKDEEK
jgi:hypothetical protein